MIWCPPAQFRGLAWERSLTGGLTAPPLVLVVGRF